MLEQGEVATLDKSRIPTDLVKLPDKFGDAMHVGIRYGYNTGLVEVQYTLFWWVEQQYLYLFIQLNHSQKMPYQYSNP